MDYLLGFIIKAVAVIIPLGFIIKLTLISLNKNKAKALEDKILKNKSVIIIWFFPVMFSLLAMGMVAGMYSDDLMRDKDTAKTLEFDNTGTIDGVEQRLVCSLPLSKHKCDQ